MVRSGEDYDSTWTVLTGGSMTGKSSLADRFALEGYRIVPEVAESYVEHAEAHGLDGKSAQRYGGSGPIPLADIAVEGNQPENEDVILDRSLGDSLYFLNRFHDVEPGDDILVDTLIDYASKQYDEICLLESVEDRVGFEEDGTRTEDRELAREIHSDLEEWYSETLGYEVNNIPVAPIEERAGKVAEAADLKPSGLSFELPD